METFYYIYALQSILTYGQRGDVMFSNPNLTFFPLDKKPAARL